jgi:hypothetical protein
VKVNVIFTDTIGVNDIYAPTSASRVLPDWYKDAPEYVGGERIIKDGNTPHTVKKCIPVFDALTAGYVIKTYVDVQVTQRDGLPYYEWPSHNAISFHPIEQAPEHPGVNGAPFPKWTNPWAIRTPPGYSTLFLPPMHNPNGIFTVLPGIVDTDMYTAPVNFPFILDDVRWEGIIPAGTPMVQIIPFRRERFQMTLGGDKERDAQAKTTGRLRSLWFNSYKRQFWSRKEYR